MRILIWQEDHPTVHGGAESWARDTAAGLKLLGHEVTWLQSAHIRETVAQLRPDAVIMGTLHCFVGLGEVYWLAEQAIPAVWMLHDYWPFCGSRMLLEDSNRSDRSCEAVQGICQSSCESRSVAQQVIRDLVKQFYSVTGCYGAAQIMRRNGINVRAVLEEGIDTGLFQPHAKERTRVVYSSAAGDDIWKGLHVLREAIQGTDIELRFLTGLSRPELAASLAGTGIYVFPSVYQEIWGLSLTEAMACGCAVVASDVAGARAQVHEGLGLLVPPRDPVALRDAIEWLLCNPDEASLMGQKASQHVRADHSLEAIGRRWEAVCQEAIKKERSTCAV